MGRKELLEARPPVPLGGQGVGHGHLRPIGTTRLPSCPLVVGSPRSVPSCFLLSLSGRGAFWPGREENVLGNFLSVNFWIYLSHLPMLVGSPGIVCGSSVWSRSLPQLSSVARLGVRKHQPRVIYLCRLSGCQNPCHHVVPPVLGYPTCPPASFHLSELPFGSLLLFPEFTVILGVEEQREVSLYLLV